MTGPAVYAEFVAGAPARCDHERSGERCCEEQAGGDPEGVLDGVERVGERVW